jgi:hypothetical protein
LKQLMKEIDTDGDGYISIAEFHDRVRQAKRDVREALRDLSPPKRRGSSPRKQRAQSNGSVREVVVVPEQGLQFDDGVFATLSCEKQGWTYEIRLPRIVLGRRGNSGAVPDLVLEGSQGISRQHAFIAVVAGSSPPAVQLICAGKNHVDINGVLCKAGDPPIVLNSRDTILIDSVSMTVHIPDRSSRATQLDEELQSWREAKARSNTPAPLGP